MRAILVILALVVLVAAATLYFGFWTLDQTRAGAISVQTPRFDADVGRVAVGTRNETVTVPTIAVERPGAVPANAQ